MPTKYMSVYDHLTFDRYSQSDIALAKRRCARQLKNGPKQELPKLTSECVLSVVIPVYNEHISRIKKQIASFNEQNINLNEIELVYIVNNPTPSKTAPDVLKNNDAIIKYLTKQKSTLTIHVIDRCTNGHELKLGNVGEARNFALHVVTKRYLDQGRDGVILQTDADTWPRSKNLLREILRNLSQPKVIGAAGGVRFVLDIDNKKTHARKFYEKHLKKITLYMRWYFLLNTKRHSNQEQPVNPTRLSGANMISMAIAAVCAGGIPELPGAEDSEFGKNLANYAKKHHYIILPNRDKWIMNTAFRESRRTSSGFGKTFDLLMKNKGKLYVFPPHSPSLGSYALKKLQVQGLYQQIDKKELPRLEKLEKQVSALRKKSEKINYTSEILNTVGFTSIKDQLLKMYRKEFPPIEITPSIYNALKKEIYKDPKTKAIAENGIKYFATFYLK